MAKEEDKIRAEGVVVEALPGTQFRVRLDNGHEVLVLQILDPREVDFAFSGDVKFKDLETGVELPTQPWHIRKEYQKLMGGFVERIRRGCQEDKIDHTLLQTDTSYDQALISFLTKRKALR